MGSIYINDQKHIVSDVVANCILKLRREYNELSVNHAYLQANHEALQAELNKYRTLLIRIKVSGLLRHMSPLWLDIKQTLEPTLEPSPEADK